jgi:selenocysteine-specific translation elongation factor
MTAAVTVAVVGATGVAKELGKKGTSSDLTLYNMVRDGHAETIVEPTQFPEKFPPLVTALGMADRCLLVLQELSRPVAETIATLELVDVPTEILLGPAVGEGEVARLLKGGRLESAPRMPLDPVKLRETVEGWNAPEVPGVPLVVVDHVFPVKGVGTVALGVVRQGTLRAHERHRLWPSPKEVEVRSIQVHDVDRKEATCGERVGLALKGVEPDEVDRGQVLGPSGALSAGSRLAIGPFERCRYYRGDLPDGAHLHLAVGLQIVPVVVEHAGAEPGSLETDRPVAFRPNDPALLLDLSAPSGPRVAGRTRLTATT